MTPQRLAAVLACALVASPVWAEEDWSGFYGGLGVGNLDVDTSIALSNDNSSYGLHAGYRFDLGRWVLGGEFEYDWSDVTLAPGVEVDNVARLKGTLGYEIGFGLLYVAVGAAEVDVTGVGDDNGSFYGLGLAVPVSPRAQISAEILEHDFDNINGSGINADATSVNVRASLRF